LARSDDTLEFLRSWWTRTYGEPEDKRAMLDQPFALVLLRWYRHLADRLRQLEAQPTKERDDWTSIEQLKKALDPTEAPAGDYLSRIEESFQGVVTTSDDPVWDRWVQIVQSGNIPASWWGEHGKPAAQKKAG
jgi:hypothetical protein